MKPRKTNRYYLLLIFAISAFLTLNNWGKAQTVSVNTLLPQDQFVCQPTILGIHNPNPPSAATINGSVGAFTPTVMGYSISNIPFVPGVPAGTAVALTDDQPSGTLNIGFTFEFLGVPYTTFRISPNGFISMGSNLPTSLFSFDANAMANDHCTPGANFPDNAILGCYQDWNPNGVTNAIRYQTTGTAPNRVLTVYYTNVPFFSTCTGTATFYIRLFETSNNIQIHIQNKPQCTGMWQGDSFSGVAPSCDTNCPSESSFAGADIAVNNTSYQYTYSELPYTGTPAATYSAPTITWQGFQGPNLGSVNTSFNPTVTPTGSALLDFQLTAQAVRRYICTVTYPSNLPCGAPYILIDTLTFQKRPYDVNFSVETPICLSETSLMSYDGTTPVSTGNPATVIAWNFGTGASPASANNLNDQNVSWNTTGIKNVTLNLSGGGCLPNDTMLTVEVVGNPSSAFTLPASACAETPVSFSVTTPITGATYVWNFDGATVLSGANTGSVNAVWNTAGNKTVSLYVVVGSCTSSVSTQNINIKPRPLSAFSPASSSVCAESALSFSYQGLTTDVAAYAWNFAGGTAVPPANTSTPSAVWNTPGAPQISLFVTGTNGCISDTSFQNITVNPRPPAALLSPDSLCLGSNINLSYNLAASAGTLYTWNLGSATLVNGNINGPGPLTVTWDQAGTFPVSLQIESAQGCISNDSLKQIEVNPIPSSQFSINPTGVCAGINSNLQHIGISGNAPQFQWSFPSTANPSGNGTSAVTVNFNSSGIQNISLLVVAEACSSSVTTQSIEVFETPTANFNLQDSVCPNTPAAIEYQGSGTPAAGYNWSFSGGSPSIAGPGSDPFSISWNTPGVKTVSLIVSEFGCSSLPFTQNINVFPTPTSTFATESPSCAGIADTLTYTGNANVTSSVFVWTVNGSTTPNLSGPGPHYVVWNAPGNYSVSLGVTENGCVSLPSQQTVTVYPVPQAAISLNSSVCRNSPTDLEASGSYPSNTIYFWNLDGANVSNAINNSGPHEISWSSDGTKTIKLNVSINGCISDTAYQNISVLPLPVANAGTDQTICSGGVAQIGSPQIAGNSYEWSPANFLSTIYEAQANANIFNPSSSVFVQNYIVSVNDGTCINRDTVSITVNEPLSAYFATPEAQCFNGHSFDFQAEGSFGSTANFNWNFGPNASQSTSTSINPQNITYVASGPQTITLQVEDNGCYSLVYTSGVLINPEPNASFTASSTEGCAPHKAFFTNTSNNSIPVTFAWDFGNGSSSEYFNPSYTYNLPGNYSVSLRVSSGNGCDTVYQISNLITVHENPLSDFLIQPTEAQILEDSLSEPVQLITSSADSVWYIVLGDTLQGMTQEIYFAAPGVYPVLMYAENEWGCRDSTLRYITVKSEGWLYIPTAFSPNNDGLNDIFQVIGQNITEFEMSIYNRWGQRVYYSRDAESGWDGRTQFGTDIVYNGMYLYKISAVDQKGNQIEREGLFTLYK